jgi:hypothetical protein
MARLGRLALIVPVASFLAALVALAPGSPATGSCAAAGSHHASLVVTHGNGSTATRCVSFAADSISGEQLLNQSGVAWSGQSFGGFGDAVCALAGEPAHYAECPGKDNYWAVFVARGGGSWQLANVGIASLVLHDGDAEGFRYEPTSGTPAAPGSAAGACPMAPKPTSTPRPTAVATQSGPVPTTAAPATAAGSTPESTVAPVTDTPPTADPIAVQPSAPAPTAPSGPDPGLLAAAIAGGGLAGLAILRIVAGRRTGP